MRIPLLPPRTPRGGLLALAALVAAVAAPAEPVGAQVRVVSYNVASLQGNPNAMRRVFAALNADEKPGFALPPHVYVFQEVKSGEVTVLQGLLDDTAPPDVEYVAGTYTNFQEDAVSGAIAMFFRDDVLDEITEDHVDLYTGAGRRTDRWHLALDGYGSPEASFYVYSSHLKASSGGQNQQTRLDGVLTIRADADVFPAFTHILYTGDMNFGSSAEPGYQAFLAAGNGQAFDPYGSGSWAGADHAIKHTQSPLLDPSGGLIGGGVDDRFDFILPTAAMFDDEGLRIMPGTMRTLGNDGNHFDQAINAGVNSYYPDDTARSNALADDLVAASDHMPLMVEIAIPALISASLPGDFGRVIHGANHAVVLTVENGADVLVAAGADPLVYTADSAGALSGAAGGVLLPLSSPEQSAFVVDTSVVGPRSGLILVSSTGEGVGNNDATLATSGLIVRPALPSFDPDAEVPLLTIERTVATGSGVDAFDVPVHNAGYDILQALLDVDLVSGAAPPFAFAGEPVAGIGPAPALLPFTFDPAGLEPGAYTAEIAILTSDEDLPGASIGALALTIEVTVEFGGGGPGDVDGDGQVDFGDLVILLSTWGPCPPGPCDADFEGDGEVGFGDLVILLSNWS